MDYTPIHRATARRLYRSGQEVFLQMTGGASADQERVCRISRTRCQGQTFDAAVRRFASVSSPRFCIRNTAAK